MKFPKYVYWQEDAMWLGYLEEFPDYWTQGETLEELKENLKDLYHGMVGASSANAFAPSKHSSLAPR